MLGFHIDMNMAQFTREYLERWLRTFAELGYDTIVWEVENNIQWETCPECVSPDAFTKTEFAQILALCRSLGLESIPLLQTIGHCEYVLKNANYAGMAEVKGGIEQYCPSKPQVREFIARWINEYLEVFGPVKYFHLGADEARQLGQCPVCSETVKSCGVAGLYANYVNGFADILTAKGITSIIWADMVLSHPETTSILSRRIMMFDWMYDIYNGNGKVFVWGKGFYDKTTLEAETIDVFGKFLFPQGDEPGREPETFYTADYLLEHGFSVVTCPGSSSYGDNVFSPRNWYHLANVHDSVRKGMSGGMSGSVLTSWTVHMFPWELQLLCIDAAARVKRDGAQNAQECFDAFAKQQLGENIDDFKSACALLSRSCLFTYTDSLGYNKSCRAVSDDYAFTRISKIKSQGTLLDEAAKCKDRVREYQEAITILGKIAQRSSSELLEYWMLAAENLLNRAQCAGILLENEIGIVNSNAQSLLQDLLALRRRTTELYTKIIKPDRCKEMMEWMYGPVQSAMEKIISQRSRI